MRAIPKKAPVHGLARQSDAAGNAFASWYAPSPEGDAATSEGAHDTDDDDPDRRRRRRYLSVKAVADRYECSTASIWRFCRNRTDFPRPIKIGPGCTRWLEDDLLAFEQSLGDGK
jgi:predicted DNA-binding transcriptional regulator AlpA